MFTFGNNLLMVNKFVTFKEILCVSFFKLELYLSSIAVALKKNSYQRKQNLSKTETFDKIAELARVQYLKSVTTLQ